MRVKLSRNVLGKRHFEATGVAGLPGWRGVGEWEVIAPGNRVAFRGSQAMNPYETVPLQESFTFMAIGQHRLEGVNAVGMSVIWQRQ